MYVNYKTIIFILGAASCVAIAFYTAPEARDPSARQQNGTSPF